LFYGLGLPEILVILFIILLLFGPKRLPELARALGQAVSECRKAVSGRLEVKKESSSEKEAIIKAAKELGVETEGKSLDEIAEEIVKKIKRD